MYSNRARGSKLTAKILLGLALAIVAVAASAQTKKCDASCLRSLSESYLAAIVKRDASKLPLAANVKYTENGKTLKVNEGPWKGASAIDELPHGAKSGWEN